MPKWTVYSLKIVQILITEKMTKLSGTDFKNDSFDGLLTSGKVDMSFYMSMDIFFFLISKITNNSHLKQIATSISYAWLYGLTYILDCMN